MAKVIGTQLKPFVDYCIVLWRDLPKTNIPDNTEDTLFNTFCKNILLYSNPCSFLEGESRVIFIIST